MKLAMYNFYICLWVLANKVLRNDFLYSRISYEVAIFTLRISRFSFRCGDADRSIMSVYCLESRCEAKSIRDAPICGTRLPHDSHGCVEGNLIDWRKAHNVRNFSASINDHSACVWECKVQ